MIINVFTILNQLYNPIIFPKNTFLFELAENCNIKVIYDEYQTNIKVCKTESEKDDIFRNNDIEKFITQSKLEQISPNILFTKAITYSAINIFKYAILNGVTFKTDQDYAKLAIRQGNLEIIKILEQYGTTFDNCLKTALYCRQNHLIDWLIENFDQKTIEISKLTNIKGLVFCLENDLIHLFNGVYSSLYENKDIKKLKYIAKFRIPDRCLYKSSIDNPIIMCLENNDKDFFDIFYENKFNLEAIPPIDIIPYIKGSTAIKLLEMCHPKSNIFYELNSLLFLSIIENQDVETLQTIVDKNLFKNKFKKLELYPMNFRHRFYSAIFSECNQKLFDFIFNNIFSFDSNVLCEFLCQKFNEHQTIDRKSIEMILKVIDKYNISYNSTIGFLLLRNAVLTNDFELVKELIDKNAPLLLTKSQQHFLNVPSRFHVYNVLTDVNVDSISVNIIKYLYDRGVSVELKPLCCVI